MRLMRFKLAAVSAAALLTACGSGDFFGLAGIAATGAALKNATVTVKCASGPVATGTTGSDGSYAVSLANGQTTPCMVKVSDGTTTLYSYADAAGRVNITPLTDMAVAKALGSDPGTAFNNYTAATGTTIKTNLDAGKTYANTVAIGLAGSTVTNDMFTGEFKVGDSNDKVLDNLIAGLTSNQQTLSTLQGTAAGTNTDAQANRGTLVEAATLVTTLTPEQIDAATTASGLMAISGTARCSVNVYAINYKTVGVANEATNASGVYLEPAGTCVNLSYLLAYAKGTDVEKTRTLANPQDKETFLLAAMYAAKGIAVVATDYLGFAKSKYSYHPYLHADSEATSVIDSIRAVRNVVQARQTLSMVQPTAITKTPFAGIFLAGYSQGGHSSMAAHRAIEKDDTLNMTVMAGAHLAGPYNLSGSFQLPDAIAGYQFFVPYLVTAWQKVYGNIYSKVGDAFKAPYDSYIETLLPNATLNYTTLITSGKLPSGPTPNQARDALFQTSFLASVKSTTSTINLAAQKNDLMAWTPKSQMLMCGGAGDPTVPPAVHMTQAKAAFDAKNLTNVSVVDVDAFVQATYGVGTPKKAPTDPTSADYATYYGNYHGSYEPPFCHAAALQLFNNFLK